MSEQQNRPLPVHLTSGSNNACSGENVSFQGGIEPIRENPTSVRILQEFRHIYEERLRNIDEEMGSEGMELKLKTLTSWINDLGEQNLMLVETVEQLEREAAGRVSLLEERLKKSSHVALEYMSKLEEYDHQIWNLSEEKGVQMVFPFNASNGLMQVQQTEEILKTRVSNLQNDISCLLELIQRAWYKGSWDTNGLNFLEVTFEDIFGPHSHQVPGGFLNPVAFDGSVFPKNNFGNPELNSASWKEKSTLETVEMKDLTKNLEDTNSHLQKIMKENECLVKEIEFLSAELKTKTDRIATLSQNSFEVDKILKQTRKSLTEEISKQHGQVVALRQCVFQLEKRVHEADVQTYFKDAIIREMRKDIRIAQTKRAIQERSQMLCIHVDDSELNSGMHGRIAVPCPCPFQRNKFHILQHQPNQACSISKSTPSCCTSHIDGNHTSLTPCFNEKKEVEKNVCMTSTQVLKTPLQQTKSHSPSKQSHNNHKKVRERIRVKTFNVVPKEPRKRFSLCGVDNSLNGKGWMGELTSSIGDSKLNTVRTKLTDVIKHRGSQAV